jgi:hypothetical protein
MSAATGTGDYTQSAADSRHDRNTAHDALHDLENALSAPGPGRHRAWLHDVAASIDKLIDALGTQAGTDADSASLLSDIATDQPRLAPRIDQLRADHRNIVAELRMIRQRTDDRDDIDVAALRDQLAETARRFRRHRSQEADLVYEAVNVDLGLGD